MFVDGACVALISKHRWHALATQPIHANQSPSQHNMSIFIDAQRVAGNNHSDACEKSSFGAMTLGVLLVLSWYMLLGSLQAMADRWGTLADNLPTARKSDFDGLKFFIYPLPPAFHSELVDWMESQGRSLGNNCDYMRSPCSEEAWSGAYSVARQWGAEVIILRKLLASPARVSDPHGADFFVASTTVWPYSCVLFWWTENHTGGVPGAGAPLVWRPDTNASIFVSAV